MADVVTRGTLLEPETVSEIFTQVSGHSTLAKLSGQEPVAFNGNDYFVFSMDDEATIVGESEKKERGHAALGKVTMRPVKIEYGARFSDEFRYGTKEKKLEILKAFAKGAAAKFARAIDIMGFHGMNPRTGAISNQLGENYIDFALGKTGNKTTFAVPSDPESYLEEAVGMLGDFDTTGFAFSKEFATALAKMKVNGVSQYPEFKLGANPGNLGGTSCDVNSTVTFGATGAIAYVGDFRKAFKWGYAKELPLEVIEYGDPDNSGRDLKGHNEVYLRTEAYIGFAILAQDAFAAVVQPMIAINKKKVEVEEDDTVTLTVNCYPAGSTVTWASSDADVATVSGGVVTGVAEGEATITASITVSGTTYTGKCAVTVKAVEA